MDPNTIAIVLSSAAQAIACSQYGPVAYAPYSYGPPAPYYPPPGYYAAPPLPPPVPPHYPVPAPYPGGMYGGINKGDHPRVAGWQYR